MEENKNLDKEYEQVSSDVEGTPAAAEEIPVTEATPATEEAPLVVADDPVPHEEPTPTPRPFYYAASEQPTRGKSGAGRFFAVFGAVTLLCVVLLVGTLFLGDEGIHIIRTLYNERTVYVRDESLATDLLTPSEAADTIKRSTVTVAVHTRSGSGVGSGFVYDNDGHICTNYHVIEDAIKIQVILPDGTVLDARVVGHDAVSDLAVLKVEHEGLVPVTLGSSAGLLVGEDVVAIGTPADINFAGTATFGKISYTNRLLPLADSTTGSVYRKINVIQTDTSLNPGNSGGPMADMYGRVVGIVVRKITNYGSTAYEGVAFAIPIDGARVILDAIIKDGRFTGKSPVAEGPSLLGVTGHTVQGAYWYSQMSDGTILSSPEELEGYYYAERSGVYVTDVSGAQANGRIYEGDIITAVNGLAMYSIQDVIAQVNRSYAGETVTVTVWRDGTNTDVQIRLAEGAIS